MGWKVEYLTKDPAGVETWESALLRFATADEARGWARRDPLSRMLIAIEGCARVVETPEPVNASYDPSQSRYSRVEPASVAAGGEG